MPNPTTTPQATPPIKIQIIKKGHHGWTIEPVDIDENVKRFLDVMDDFSKKRKGRRPKRKPDHLPIIFFEGDTLTFTCTLEFAIGAKKDDVVDEIPGTPDSPFGWKELQIGEAGGLVTGVVMTGSGVKEQAFYKFHGWVIENGSKVPVDPCGYCGS